MTPEYEDRGDPSDRVSIRAVACGAAGLMCLFAAFVFVAAAYLPGVPRLHPYVFLRRHFGYGQTSEADLWAAVMVLAVTGAATLFAGNPRVFVQTFGPARGPAVWNGIGLLLLLTALVAGAVLVMTRAETNRLFDVAMWSGFGAGVCLLVSRLCRLVGHRRSVQVSDPD